MGAVTMNKGGYDVNRKMRLFRVAAVLSMFVAFGAVGGGIGEWGSDQGRCRLHLLRAVRGRYSRL